MALDLVLPPCVRREDVTEAAGKIAVLDQPKLEAQVCECHAVVRRETDRLLSRETASVDLLS
jgi:hypothetical protein